MASIVPPFDRHSMVRADPTAWARMLADRRDLAEESLLMIWAQQGWPLVARRPVQGDVLGDVALGLPLPPTSGSRRLRFCLSPKDLTDSGPPPRLSEAMAAAPQTWRPTIASLVTLDPEVRCFGSLAWQHLTGLLYLSTDSDLDLLWRVTSAETADVLASQIASIAERAPMRIDGEFITPAGAGVQWWEWRSPARELMAKDRDGVRLADRAGLLS